MSNDTITLATDFEVVDSQGNKNKVKRLYVYAESYCPDVFAEFEKPAYYESRNSGLYDGVVIYAEDEAIKDQLNAKLVELGYNGPKIGRAEYGMQSEYVTVLEPGKEIDPLLEKLGWKNLNEEEDEEGKALFKHQREDVVVEAYTPKYWVVKWKNDNDVMLTTARKSMHAAIEAYCAEYAKEYDVLEALDLYYGDPSLEVVLVELNTLITVEH